jgi:hypothetical protein
MSECARILFCVVGAFSFYYVLGLKNMFLLFYWSLYLGDLVLQDIGFRVSAGGK